MQNHCHRNAIADAISYPRYSSSNVNAYYQNIPGGIVVFSFLPLNRKEKEIITL